MAIQNFHDALRGHTENDRLLRARFPACLIHMSYSVERRETWHDVDVGVVQKTVTMLDSPGVTSTQAGRSASFVLGLCSMKNLPNNPRPSGNVLSVLLQIVSVCD